MASSRNPQINELTSDSEDDCPEFNSVSLRHGTAVEVLSQTARGWMPGHIGCPVKPTHTTVEFDFDGRQFRKHLAPGSQRLLLTDECFSGSGYFSDAEAFHGLTRRAFVRFNGKGLAPITDELQLVLARNNAFTTTMPLKQSCCIEYHGPFDEDMLLKVYALDAQCLRHDYRSFELRGYVHAMQKPRCGVQVEAGHLLGLSIHKDLNKNWLWRLTEEDYKRFIKRSDQYGSQNSVPCERFAEDADYLISFTTGNKVENDLLLQRLSTIGCRGPHGDGPIKFCTDRSLGFGGHFDAPAGLFLAKHGFGQPAAHGAQEGVWPWWQEYKKASEKVRIGLLVLNPSPAYFRSVASMKEYYELPRSRRYFYVAAFDRIMLRDDFGAAEWKAVFGATDLHIAAKNGEVAMVQELLACRADPTLQDGAGDTPLMEAVAHGPDAVQVLLAAMGAESLNERNSNGNTALIIAARKGRTEVLQTLLAECCAPNLATVGGMTALMWAVRGAHEQMTMSLLCARAAVEMQDETGTTALDLARQSGNVGILRLLEDLCPRVHIE